MIKKAFKVLRFYKDILLMALMRPFLSKFVMLQHTPDFVTQLNLIPDFSKNSGVFRKRSKRSYGDPNRYMQFHLLLSLVKDLPTGDYAELGTYRGVTARIIYENMAKSSGLVCFDTFEGFAESDVKAEKTETNLEVKTGHFSDTSLEFVSDYIRGSQSQSDNLKLVKGLFPGTFEGYEDHKWRFVHLDCDLYEPMKAGLEKFWPNIVPGGILLIHDYNGTYLGVKKAVDEYFVDKPEIPIPLYDKVGSIVIAKPKTA